MSAVRTKQLKKLNTTKYSNERWPSQLTNRKVKRLPFRLKYVPYLPVGSDMDLIWAGKWQFFNRTAIAKNPRQRSVKCIRSRREQVVKMFRLTSHLGRTMGWCDTIWVGSFFFPRFITTHRIVQRRTIVVTGIFFRADLCGALEPSLFCPVLLFCGHSCSVFCELGRALTWERCF